MSDIRFNRWLHQSGTGGVYQNGSGRVGIGSSTPTEILDVVGNISASGDIVAGGYASFGAGVVVSSGSSIGIGTDDAKFTLDVRGETSFGEGMDNTNLGWGPDAYQRVYSFSGASGGSVNSPADGALLTSNPNTNPSNTRVGTFLFGNSVVGTSNTTTNPGIKGAIDCFTNTNISTNPDDTGGRINIFTKPDGLALRTSMTIDSEGRVTKPHQPGFYARRTVGGDGRASGVITEWHISGTGSYNDGGHFKTSGTNQGKFVAPVTGNYYFSAQPGYKQTSQNFQFYFRINGTNVNEPVRVIDGGDDLTSHSAFTGSFIVRMGAGDTMDIYIGYTHHVNTILNFFCGYLIG